MSYKIIKVLNNNSVLVQSSSGNQVVLMSKGIGYGKKTGEQIMDRGKDQRLFYILDSGQNINKLEKFGTEHEKMEAATHKIVEIAKTKLNLKNENLYAALLDHLTFAVERLQMGLPINNPYVKEISVLYQQEYEIAQIAAYVIKEQLNIEIGMEETGFIALHIYSAHKNKCLSTVMKDTRVMSEILNMALQHAEKSIDTSFSAAADFLISLSQLIQDAAAKKDIHMRLKSHVKYYIPHDWYFAQKIAGYIGHEFNVSLKEDYIAFLAVDIYKLTQM